MLCIGRKVEAKRRQTGHIAKGSATRRRSSHTVRHRAARTTAIGRGQVAAESLSCDLRNNGLSSGEDCSCRRIQAGGIGLPLWPSYVTSEQSM